MHPRFVTFAVMAIVAVPLVAIGPRLRWLYDRRALEGLRRNVSAE